MSKKSSSFIFSWPMIVALIFGYNFLFDDDDEKTIDVETQVVIEETTDKPSELSEKLKEFGSQAKELLKDGVAAVKEELEKEGDTEIAQTQDKQDPEEEIIEERRKEAEETVKTIEEEPKEEKGKFRKL